MRTDLQPRPTSMAVAFYQACINATSRASVPLVRKVQSSISRNVGLVKERSMNANVSYRAAQKLKQQGVL